MAAADSAVHRTSARIVVRAGVLEGSGCVLEIGRVAAVVPHVATETPIAIGAAVGALPGVNLHVVVCPQGVGPEGVDVARGVPDRPQAERLVGAARVVEPD